MKTKRNRKQSTVRKVINFTVGLVIAYVVIAIFGIAALQTNVAGSPEHPSIADKVISTFTK